MAVTPVTRHCRGFRAPASEHCSHPRPTASTGADARGMGPGSLLLGEGLAGWAKRRALVKGSRVCWTRKLRQTVMVWVGPTQKKVEPLETQTPWLSLQPPGGTQVSCLLRSLVLAQALPRLCCVILSKAQTLSGPQGLHRQHEGAY